MKLEQIKQLEITRVGNQEGGVQAGIAEESMPFVFELVSKQLYSNPVGSVVREITSNCFDANIEAGVDNPVVISKKYDSDEGYSIEFQDRGIGLSGRRLVDVYMNYFSSTKRLDNTQIGGFGIGSKTPLAYSDLFYISSVHNGLKYDCILHKGEAKPELESFYGWEEETVEGVTKKYPLGIETDEPNGTTIKVVMQSNDVTKFMKELKYQLAYFDNVYFVNWGISNDYDIYEGNYFKFRSDMPQYSGRYSSDYTELHLCIGKVRYPIDFKRVKVDENVKEIPIAIKFDIGEIQVTPSRETIRYSDATIKLMEERIQLAVSEVKEIFYKQNPLIEDLAEYTKLLNDNPKITFNAEKKHYLYAWRYSGLDKGFRFAPLDKLPIKLSIKNLFFLYEHVGTINSSGKFTKFSFPTNTVDNEFILRNKFVVAEKHERFSLYTDAHIEERVGGSVEVIRKREIDFTNKTNYLTLTTALGIKDRKDVSKTKTIIEFMKIINNEMFKYGNKYQYYKPTDQWIADYKRRMKESSAAYLRKMNNKVFVRSATNRFKGTEMRCYDLEHRHGILVYGYKDDRDILEAIYNQVTRNNAKIRSINSEVKRDKAFMVLQVSKSAEEGILGAKKTIYWPKFLQTMYLRKIETAYHIWEELRSLRYMDGLHIRKQLIKDYEADYTNLINSLKPYLNIDRYGNFDASDNIFIPKEHLSGNYLPKMMEAFHKFVNKHHYNIPLIGCLDSSILKDDRKIDSLIDYLKDKKIRLKNEWYLRPTIR